MEKIGTLDVTATAEPIAELDRLGDKIAELSAHIEAATASLLDLIREFDARGGWNHGFRTCAHWLTWRVGLDLGAARERVRVARALGALPLLSEALARGELSYAKVRALTRVATPEIEERLLAVGKAGTACHVERIVRGWRRVDAAAEARETAQRHKSRALHVYQDEDGMVVVRGRLTPETGAVLMQALAAARETLYQQTRSMDPLSIPGGVSAETPSMPQQQADALALLAETALHHGIDPGAPGKRYQVVVHVDAPVLADPEAPGQSVLEGGTHVSAETSRRLACDATSVIMRHEADGRIVEVGARTRTIPRRSGARYTTVTAAAGSRAAACRSARAITFVTGPRAGLRRCRTSRCCAGAITPPSTKRDIRWNDSRTVSYGSGDRTDDLYPMSLRRQQSRTTPSRRSEHGTRRPGFTCTRGRRARAGWESHSTWGGRSTSCTRGPSSPRRSASKPSKPWRIRGNHSSGPSRGRPSAKPRRGPSARKKRSTRRG